MGYYFFIGQIVRDQRVLTWMLASVQETGSFTGFRFWVSPSKWQMAQQFYFYDYPVDTHTRVQNDGSVRLFIAVLFGLAKVANYQLFLPQAEFSNWYATKFHKLW